MTQVGFCIIINSFTKRGKYDLPKLSEMLEPSNQKGLYANRFLAEISVSLLFIVRSLQSGIQGVRRALDGDGKAAVKTKEKFKPETK